MVQEGFGQCWGIVVFEEGLQVEVVYCLQVGVVGVVVVYYVEVDVLVGDFGLFLVDVFVVFVVYCVEELVECCLVIWVLLLELYVFVQQLVIVEQCFVCCGVEVDMG